MKHTCLRRCLTLLFLAAPVLVAASPPVPQHPLGGARPAISPEKSFSDFTFDSDNQGWLETYVGRPDGAGYDRLYPNTPAIHTFAEGNPPGSILQTVGVELDQRAYWQGYYGEVQFLGDLADAHLQVDVYSTGNWRTIADGADGDDGTVYARWVISTTCATNPALYDMFISTRSASVDLNGFTGWQTFTVDLTDANFFRWPNGVCGSLGFTDVLQAYDQIGLYIFSGTDDVADINGGTGTWISLDGVSRLKHYGGYAESGQAAWGLDNLVGGGNSVPDLPTSMGSVKALFR